MKIPYTCGTPHCQRQNVAQEHPILLCWWFVRVRQQIRRRLARKVCRIRQNFGPRSSMLYQELETPACAREVDGRLLPIPGEREGGPPGDAKALSTMSTDKSVLGRIHTLVLIANIFNLRKFPSSLSPGAGIIGISNALPHSHCPDLNKLETHFPIPYSR